MKLTPEQEAYLKKLADRHYYGEQNADGVDLSLIRENLKLSPIERVRRGHRAAAGLQKLRKDAKRVK